MEISLWVAIEDSVVSTNRLLAITAAEGRLVGLGLLGSFLLFGLLNVRTLVYGLLSYRYSTTDGSGRKRDDGTIEYEYVVGGEKLKGTRLSYFITRPQLMDDINHRLDSCSVAAVHVYFDPLNPRRSVLQRGITVPSAFWILMWSFAMFSSIALALNLFGICRYLHWDNGGGGL